jgi:hypothetical protein
VFRLSNSAFAVCSCRSATLLSTKTMAGSTWGYFKSVSVNDRIRTDISAVDDIDVLGDLGFPWDVDPVEADAAGALPDAIGSKPRAISYL